MAIGVGFSKAKFNKPDLLGEALSKLGVSDLSPVISNTMVVVEFPLSLVESDNQVSDLLKKYCHEKVYQKFSAFPRIIRDIALFVPEGTSPESVADIITSNAGDLLVRGPVLFDEFHKDGRVSLAFRLVFQSPERTLSDVEIKEVMDKVESELKKQGDFEVRN